LTKCNFIRGKGLSVKVAIVTGSKSDIAVAEKVETVLREFGIDYETAVISAHRNPNKIKKFAGSAEGNGFSVIVAIAGLAAHLPGVVASLTTLPVIGIPVETGPLNGRDALYSIVQMPPGIPVASVGIGNATNAALLAVEILGGADHALRAKMKEYRKRFGDDEN
jgi:phosphoribosylaminoimidazole carboxylase PurE protein